MIYTTNNYEYKLRYKNGNHELTGSDGFKGYLSYLRADITSYILDEGKKTSILKFMSPIISQLAENNIIRDESRIISQLSVYISKLLICYDSPTDFDDIKDRDYLLSLKLINDVEEIKKVFINSDKKVIDRFIEDGGALIKLQIRLATEGTIYSGIYYLLLENNKPAKDVLLTDKLLEELRSKYRS